MSDQQQVDDSQATPEEKSAETVLYGDESKDESQADESQQEEGGKAAQAEAGEAEESTEQKAEEKTDGEFVLTLPEETLLSEEALKEVSEFAKEQGIAQETAQKILEMQSGIVSELEQQLQSDQEKQIADWGDEIRNDKEYGGENLEANVELAKRAIKSFAGEEFLQELNDTGYANHPRLFKMMVKIGKEIEAGGLIIPGAQPDKPKSPAEILYGPSVNDNN